MGPEKGRERRRVFISDGTAGTQTRGPNWRLGYRVHRAKGQLRICLIPFLCPRGVGCVRAGHVEVAEWGSRLSSHGGWFRLVGEHWVRHPAFLSRVMALTWLASGVELRGPRSWDLQGLWQTLQA